MIRPPTPDALPDALNRWRWIVSGSIVAGGLVLATMLVVSTGWFEKFPGVAMAADVDQQIDKKIEEALQPVLDKLDAQGTKLDAQDVYLKRLVSKDIRADIYEKLTAFCAAEQRQKARIRSELDELQVEFREATGERYPEPRCEDI